MARQPMSEAFRTRFEYIHFVKTGDTGKTSIWECLNNSSGAILGEVRWYGPWRQYIFLPVNSFYSAGCLQDVITFIASLDKERRGV